MATCYVCQSPKAALACGCCKEDICKNCAQFVEEEQFSFMTRKPEVLSYTTYCGPCFDREVSPQMSRYDDMMRQAEQVSIFLKNQGKETRNFKRLEAPVVVENCNDREETLLRLAFKAVERNFNGVIDVDLVSKKVRQGSYQTQIWSGTGIPAEITAGRKTWV